MLRAITVAGGVLINYRIRAAKLVVIVVDMLAPAAVQRLTLTGRH